MKEQMKFELARGMYRYYSVFLFIEITRCQSTLIIIIQFIFFANGARPLRIQNRSLQTAFAEKRK